MKYMVFIIYLIVIGQFINSKPFVKNDSVRRSRNFYKISGIINFIGGFCGMSLVNLFLRDKDIIPQMFVLFTLAGFSLTMIYGMYCIYKMMCSLN